MNAVISNLLNRRSVRSFSTQSLTEEDVETILQAGLYAPTSMGKQSVVFLAVKGQKAIAEFELQMKQATHRQLDNRYREWVTSDTYTVNYGAPVFIATLADPTYTSSPEADCACALENMFLAAHSINIGSCWINQVVYLHEDKQFRAYMSDLGLAEGLKFYGGACFGKPAADWPKAAVRKENRCVSVGSL